AGAAVVETMAGSVAQSRTCFTRGTALGGALASFGDHYHCDKMLHCLCFRDLMSISDGGLAWGVVDHGVGGAERGRVRRRAAGAAVPWAEGRLHEIACNETPIGPLIKSLPEPPASVCLVIRLLVTFVLVLLLLGLSRMASALFTTRREFAISSTGGSAAGEA